MSAVYRYDELEPREQDQVYDDLHYSITCDDWPERGHEVLNFLLEAPEFEMLEAQFTTTIRSRITGGLQFKLYWDELFRVVDTEFDVRAQSFTKSFPAFEEHMGFTIQEWLAYTAAASCGIDIAFTVNGCGRLDTRICAVGYDIESSDSEVVLDTIRMEVFGLIEQHDPDTNVYEWVEGDHKSEHNIEARHHTFFAGASVIDLFGTPEEFQVHLDSAIGRLETHVESFLDKGKKSLETEHDYIFSQEYFADLADANEWLFTRASEHESFDLVTHTTHEVTHSATHKN